MDKATVAIIVSIISAVIAGLSLGWNIYRDVVLKPKLKVKFSIRKLFTPGIDQMSQYISISATNFGKTSITIEKICLKSLKKELLVFTDPQLGLPKELAPGKKVEFSVPYDQAKCDRLLNKSNRIGLEDSFDRIHWVKRREFKKVCQKWQKDLKSGEIPQGEGAVRQIV